MENITTCPLDLLNESEFIQFNECGISANSDIGIRITSIVLVSIIFIIEAIILILRKSHFDKKNNIAKILIFSALFINPILLIRPAIGLFSKHRAVNNFGVSIFTNFSASLIANIAILFVFFEVNLLHKGSLKSDNKAYALRKIFLGSLAIIQSILYIGGSIFSYYTNSVTLSQVFWFATSITDTTLIPYLCIFGITLYQHIKRMHLKTHNKLSRQLLIIIISCSVLGSFTDVVSLTLFFLNGTYYIEWIFLELCWIAAIIFCSCIFIILMRKTTKNDPVSTNSSKTTKSKSVSSNSPVSTNST